MNPAESKLAVPGTVPGHEHPKRLVSLDVLRGATVAAMMLVNNPGDWNAVYAPLRHAAWHGWTFTDLVFPFFLWIVGVSLHLSTARRLECGQARSDLLRHSLRRALILFGLGLFLNSFGYLIDGSLFRDGLHAWAHHYLTNVRLPGVLQRIAACYFLASVLVIYTPFRVQVASLAVLLAVYWALMLIPVETATSTIFDKGANFAGYVDNLVFNGPIIGTHVWKSAGTWDPEGIVSTLTATATCLFGVIAGAMLRSNLTQEARTCRILVSSNILVAAGLLMDVLMPINKNLWTVSYTVFTAGMAGACFGVCYWVIDVQGWRRCAKPFEIYGTNAITIFVLAGLLGRLVTELKMGTAPGSPSVKSWLYQMLFVPIASAENASLLWATMCVLFLYLIAWAMYRRGWIVKF